MENRGRSPIALLSLLSQAGVAVISANYATGMPAVAQQLYQTLDFGTAGTFLTGIRGENIVGNYVIPGASATGGLLYKSSTATWTPFPVETASGTNFPGSTSSSPY